MEQQRTYTQTVKTVVASHPMEMFSAVVGLAVLAIILIWAVFYYKNKASSTPAPASSSFYGPGWGQTNAFAGGVQEQAATKNMHHAEHQAGALSGHKAKNACAGLTAAARHSMQVQEMLNGGEQGGLSDDHLLFELRQ